jgi:transposase
MIRHAISDADWHRLAPLLPGRPGTPGRSGDDNRRFLHAVNWIARAGAPWRDLPPELGRWNSVWRRFDRWSKNGVWRRIAERLQDPDFDWVAIDSTTVRAHQHAAGARKRGIPPSRPPRARRSGAAEVA